MNLKNIQGIFVLMLVALMPFASAVQTNLDFDADVEARAGTTPDSSLYIFESAAESIDLALTFNKEKRAEKGIEQAQERLAEIKVMLEKNNTDAAEKARVKYDQSIEVSNEAIAELEVESDVEKSRDAFQKIITFESRAEAHFDLLVAIKTRILEKRGDNITAAQKASFESFFEKLESKNAEVKTKLDEKKNKIEINYKASSGKSDEEIAVEEEKIQVNIKEDVLALRTDLGLSVNAKSNVKQDSEVEQEDSMEADEESDEESSNINVNSNTRIKSDSDENSTRINIESDVKVGGKI